MVSSERPTFLFGELGSGKSTLVGNYVIQLSEKIEGLLPVLIPAGFFRDKEITTVSKLIEYISDYINEQINPVQKSFNLIKALQEKIELTLVIDGFDELNKGLAKTLLLRAEELVGNWSGLRIIATGRPIELQGLDYSKWQCLEMVSLSQDEQKAILVNEALAAGMNSDNARKDADERLKVLSEMPELLSIATTPLTIRLMRPYLSNINERKTLGDLLYEISKERLGEWNQKQGKEATNDEFCKMFPDVFSREKILGLIAAEIFKAPNKSISRECLYTLIESEVMSMPNKNKVVSQACDFFIKNVLHESDNTITFPSQPLLQCALAIHIVYELRANESVNFVDDYVMWREYSFAASIARCKNLINSMRHKFLSFINELIKRNNEGALPAVALIIAEADDIELAKNSLSYLSNLSFRPIRFFSDIKSISAAAFARWFYLAGEEGFNWFYDQYLNPKYPTSIIVGRDEDLIFKYWLLYSNFTLKEEFITKLSALISPCIAARSWQCNSYLPTISLAIPSSFDIEQRVRFIASNLTSDIFREKAINMLKDEFTEDKKALILDTLESVCSRGDDKFSTSSRLWLELCLEKPPASIVDSIITASINAENFSTYEMLGERIGKDNLACYLNFCVMKNSKLACAAAILLFRQGERNLNKLGYGLIEGLHDGGKVKGAEEALYELISANWEDGLDWLTKQFTIRERDMGAYSAYWRILLEGLLKISPIRSDLLGVSLYQLGEFILPRYPEIRRGFQNLLLKKVEYKDFLKKLLNSLDNKIRYRAACILMTCFPEDEIYATEIVIKSTIHSFKNGEWNSFCMRLKLGEKILEHIYEKINMLHTVPKTFALALLYHNEKKLSEDEYRQLIIGLLGAGSFLDVHYSHYSNVSLKQILAQDSCINILIECLDENKLCKEAAYALLQHHQKRLSPDVIVQCICILLDSFDNFKLHMYLSKFEELAKDRVFIEKMQAYSKSVQERTSQEPFIGIYLRTIDNINAWKDLLWTILFCKADSFKSHSDIEWSMMWVLDKGRCSRAIGEVIGLAAKEFLDHSSVNADRMYNDAISWLALLAHEFSGLSAQKIEYVVMNTQPISQEITAALLSRLGYVPQGFKAKDNREYLAPFMKRNTNASDEININKIIEITRDSDEIHNEYCIYIDRTLILGLFNEDDLGQIAIKSLNGALFSSIVCFCRNNLKEYNWVTRNIGLKLSKNENNQTAKVVNKVFLILRSVIANTPTAREEYFKDIEETIKTHSHTEIVYLYKELLNNNFGLKSSLLEGLFYEITEKAYYLDWELGHLLADYIVNEIKEEEKPLAINCLKKAISSANAEVKDLPSIIDGIREWLLSLAYFYLIGEIDEESERLFLIGLQSAFIHHYDIRSQYGLDRKYLTAKEILNVVYPLLDRVSSNIIQRCIQKGVVSDIPEVSTVCKLLLNLAGGNLMT